MDPVVTMNAIAGTIIFILGLWAYSQRKGETSLFVGLGFGFFAVTHTLTLLGQASSFAQGIFVLWVIGYLLVIYAMARLVAARSTAQR